MTDPQNPVLQFMLTRRSRPAKLMRAPGPDRAALEPLLQAAARVPDHGKLEPWRFVVLQQPAGARVAQQIMNYAHNKGLEGEKPARAFFGQPGLRGRHRQPQTIREDPRTGTDPVRGRGLSWAGECGLGHRVGRELADRLARA